MKKVYALTPLLIMLVFLYSCTKTESDFGAGMPETIAIQADAINVLVGARVNFSVTSSINNATVTGESKIYVNGAAIVGSNYIFKDTGTYSVHAVKGALNTNVLTIVASTTAPTTTGFLDRILVEEYSGTWCGNCPRILYGVELLHKQTDKAIVVSTHLFNDDPYITSQGNSLAAILGVTGVPTGYINRSISWRGPQYENVNQVVEQLKGTETMGLAISSAVSGNTLNAAIKIAYAQPITGSAKLTVYLVEDKLRYTQRNYSSNLYDGQASISNFQYDGVIRSIVSNLQGDAIANTGTLVEKQYLLALPANISNRANVRLVAFVTNEAGEVINVQDAAVGTSKDFERI